MSTNLQIGVVATTGTSDVQENHEWSALIDDLVKLSTLPPTLEHLERLAYALSVKTSTALHQHIVVDASIGTMTAAKVANQLSAISIYNNQSLAVVYLRTAALQLCCDTSTSATAPNAPSHALNNKMTDCIRMILPVVSNCVIQCLPQRSVIKETGILESLWALVEKEGKNSLSSFVCEFLQACIYAKEYYYAYQQIFDTWPIPSNDFLRKGGHLTSSVEILLRYYYLRGILCMGCESEYYPLAIRCFWTCLSVPVASDANAVSAIAVAAWKKMILLQCLSPIGILYTTTTTTGKSNSENPLSKSTPMSVVSSGNVPTVIAPTFTNPLSTPKDMAWDLVRFFAQAKPPPNARFSNQSSSAAEKTSSSAQSTESSIFPHFVDSTEGSMHIIEMDTGLNRLGVDSSIVVTRNSGRSSDNPASTDSMRGSQSTTDSAPTNLLYPSLGVYVYKQLVQAYASTDRRKFDAILQECSELFDDDGNVGLVRCVGLALLHRHIYELSRVYGTIMLDDLAREMNLPAHVLHSSLVDLQTRLAWPVELVPSSPTSTMEESKSNIRVVFPPELPRPVLDAYNADISLVNQLNDLTVTVQQLDTAIAASPKYKAALNAAERRNLNTSSVLGPMNVEEL